MRFKLIEIDAVNENPHLIMSSSFERIKIWRADFREGNSEESTEEISSFR